MTEDDLARIEAELAIRLPDGYRSAMVPFPIPWDVGNSDSPAWDDPAALIGLNRTLRAEVSGWPPWLFAIGQTEGDPCGHAIDVREPEGPVWWLDHMELGRHSGAGPNPEPFAAWLAQVAADSEPDVEVDARLIWIVFVIWPIAAMLAVVASWFLG